MELSVIIPTHNPEPERLRRSLLALRAQTLPPERWEVVLVNNASDRFPPSDFFAACAPGNFTLVRESILGLSAARRCGFVTARGDFAVLVDDDNVLTPEYLSSVLSIFQEQPQLGAAGGKSLPEFAVKPPEWSKEFHALLALRDLGEKSVVAPGFRSADSGSKNYPPCAPLGAGMALRRAAWMPWLIRSPSPLTDRRGTGLSSGGDNDLVLCALHAGWDVGYFPQLALTHLIPAARLDPNYLIRLNRDIQRSWMQVLTLHAVNPWSPLSSWGATLRKFKAWFTYRAWTSDPARIRWGGACGHFDGRVSHQ